ERVGIWTRRLSEVTRSLPDVVETARRELGAAPFILDGEVLALDAAGRPLPFQELMRRFRRVHEVERLVREMPLTLHFFDCLMADGHSLVGEPYARRWEALAAVTGGRHLAVRDGDAFADVGKTFKGLTDQQFVAMTERLWALATSDEGYTVRVRPEVVVEVAYNEIQKSPTYRSGMALRFARITRIRDDKAPGQAATLDELSQLYERQFATKGRSV